MHSTKSLGYNLSWNHGYLVDKVVIFVGFLHTKVFSSFDKLKIEPL